MQMHMMRIWIPVLNEQCQLHMIDTNEMRLNIENDIVFLRDQIEKVVQFLDRVHGRTLDYANKWVAQKVDNT